MSFSPLGVDVTRPGYDGVQGRAERLAAAGHSHEAAGLPHVTDVLDSLL